MSSVAAPARSLDRRNRLGSRVLLLVSALAGLAGLSLLAPQLAGATATPNGKYAAWLAYSRCMRAHRVPDFPDPRQVAGGGIQIPGTQLNGLSPDSPVFVSAQRSCRRLLPGGGQSTLAGQQQERARMLRSSRCMRAQGISGFPDPSLAPPSNRAGFSSIMSNDGVWLAIPSSIDVRSPAFRRAAAACDLGLS